MGTREKLFRQKLANQIEELLTHSEKVFTSEKLNNTWLNGMISKNRELNRVLTIYQFLHDLPENEKLQVEFLELKEEEESIPEREIPSYGDEILKEIDEFETNESIEVFEVVEDEIIDDTPVEAVESEESVKTNSNDEIDNVSINQEVETVTEKESKENEQETISDTEKSVDTETVEVEEEHTSTIVNEGKVEITSPETTEETKKEINDAVANTAPSLADKLSIKSIRKLADSIALNERFLFSNELFNGNMEVFKRALTELDHIASKEDAHRYIEVQLQKENNWDMKSDTVQSFISLVDRRFN